jgi:predicted acylesterase/phospholipase RssA
MSETNPKLKNMRIARLFLSGETLVGVNPIDLAYQLKDNEQYAYAAEVFLKVLTTLSSIQDRKKILQQLAICIYKDPDLPTSTKFEDALRYLREVDDWDANDSDVLGKLGATFKHCWYQNNRFEHLLHAEYFYKTGYNNWKANRSKYLLDVEMGDDSALDQVADTPVDPENTTETALEDRDAGYNAINYAFVLDLMAYVWRNMTSTYADISFSQIAQDQDIAEGWVQKAIEVRQDIIEYMPKLELAVEKHNQKHPKESEQRTIGPWINATLGEAYFGLAKFDKAKEHYLAYHNTDTLPWQKNATARQMLAHSEFKIAAIKNQNGSKADMGLWQVNARNCYITLMAGEASDKQFPQRITRGKLGLGLSGGGFRAAFFHIGVLAALAELDVLRHTEVLSCVSGGSIVGAYYYLLLKERLEQKTDQQPVTGNQSNETALTSWDYIEVVQELVTEFTAGVQTNLRMQILADYKANRKIFFKNGYTRTSRLAELYESQLYSRTRRKPEEADLPFLMHDLKMMTDQHFNVKTDNWRRHFKIPQIILNATTLNTGHNWQFTASWMGEPPANIKPDIDSKPRLRRMYYSEAPPPYRNNVRLGTAVGASSCVPALFTPVHLPELYEDHEVFLVDGGVHDNQGIASLIEQECKIMIVSDASGQINAEKTSSDDIIGTLSRADSILQARVREAQIMDLKERKASGQITALSIVHLTKDLQANPIKWKYCEDPTRQKWLTAHDGDNTLRTTYGILKTVQEKLAGIRTDLDAFNDAEAYALMYSGYRQMYSDFVAQKLVEYFPAERAIPQETDPAKAQERWKFMSIEPYMTNVEKSQRLLPRLELGQMMAMRAFKLMPALRYTIYGFMGLLVAGAIYAFFVNWDKALATITVSGLGIYLILNLLARIGGPFAAKVIGYKTIISKFAAAVLLAALTQAYLRFVGPKYLEYGKIAALDKEKKVGRWLRWWRDYLN